MPIILYKVIKFTRKSGAVFIATIIGGVFTGTAIASIPDSNGVIHACYSNTKTQIIDNSATSCKSNETSISWNQQGSNGTVLKSNLVGADFTGASMSNWDLSGLNLTDTDFSNSRLVGVILKNANIDGAHFDDAILDKADLSNLIFSRASSFKRAHFVGSILSGANLSNTDFTGAYLTGQDLSDKNLTGVTFSQTQLQNANLSKATFTGGIHLIILADHADFSYVDLTNDTLEFSTLDYANFSNANLSGVTFGQGVSLYGSTFTNSIVTNTTWSSSVTCPDGATSGDNGNTCIGHLVP